VLIGYSLEMQYSKQKHNFTKENKRIYNKNYHLLKVSYDDKNVRIVVIRCDLCNDPIPQSTEENVIDNLETRIKIIDEINDSFEGLPSTISFFIRDHYEARVNMTSQRMS